MIEYKIVQTQRTAEDTQVMLNNLATEGWRVQCSVGKHCRNIILKRKVREK